jgi:hypothetical protein
MMWRVQHTIISTPVLMRLALALVFVMAASNTCANVLAQRVPTADTIAHRASPRYTAFLYPRNPQAWQTMFAADASVTLLPRLIVEESVRVLPMLGASMRLGLPEHFGLHARLRSIFLTNLATVGVSWSYSVGAFSAAVHNNIGVWAGFSGVLEGFDTNAFGPMNFAGLSLGTELPDGALLTLRTELVSSLGYTINLGPTRIPRQTSRFQGVDVTLCVEQPVGANGHRIVGGLRTAYSRPSYEAWVAFSDIQDFLFYPMIFFGYAF